MNFVRTASIALVLLICNNLNAQDKAFLVLCDAAPGQLIVLDSQGNWIPEVKSVSITIGVDGKSEMTTTSYAGVIKPTNPATKTYELVQIKSVTRQQFSGIIDGLQTDPAYVKTSGTFGSRPRANVNDPNERTNNNSNNDNENNDNGLELDDGDQTAVSDTLTKLVNKPISRQIAVPDNITDILLAMVKGRFGDKVVIDGK